MDRRPASSLPRCRTGRPATPAPRSRPPRRRPSPPRGAGPCPPAAPATASLSCSSSPAGTRAERPQSWRRSTGSRCWGRTPPAAPAPPIPPPASPAPTGTGCRRPAAGRCTPSGRRGTTAANRAGKTPHAHRDPPARAQRRCTASGGADRAGPGRRYSGCGRTGRTSRSGTGTPACGRSRSPRRGTPGGGTPPPAPAGAPAPPARSAESGAYHIDIPAAPRMFPSFAPSHQKAAGSGRIRRLFIRSPIPSAPRRPTPQQ